MKSRKYLTTLVFLFTGLLLAFIPQVADAAQDVEITLAPSSTSVYEDAESWKMMATIKNKNPQIDYQLSWQILQPGQSEWIGFNTPVNSTVLKVPVHIKGYDWTKYSFRLRVLPCKNNRLVGKPVFSETFKIPVKRLPTVDITDSAIESSSNGSGKYHPGDRVYIHAGKKEHAQFSHWSTSDIVLTDPKEADTSFIMPNHGVVLKANWHNFDTNMKLTLKHSSDIVYDTDKDWKTTANLEVCNPTYTYHIQWEMKTGLEGTWSRFSQKNPIPDSEPELILPIKGWNHANKFFRCKVYVVETQQTFYSEAFTVPTPIPQPQVHVINSYGKQTDGWDGSGLYHPGDAVPLNAGSREGFTFLKWTSEDVTLNNPLDIHASFTMPNHDVTVTVHWQPKETEKPPVENPFIDVTPSDYYYEPVLWAVSATPQITSGITPYTFHPEYDCTRGQAVTFLWRAAGEPMPTSLKNPFTDISTSDYYYNAVLWAAEQGITSGATPTTFAPTKTCTRGEIVTFIWRANGSPDVTLMNPFKDVNNTDYYAKAVQWAVNNNITNGTSATTFSPTQNCTRGQIVTFLYNAYHTK